jgi:hypothetical protein
MVFVVAEKLSCCADMLRALFFLSISFFFCEQPVSDVRPQLKARAEKSRRHTG